MEGSQTNPLTFRVSFRVGCTCGRRAPWAKSVRRAIEIWNETADM